MKPVALFILSTENLINPDKDTSYLFMLEAQRRGFDILICDHKGIHFTYNSKDKKINVVVADRAHAVEVLERVAVKDRVYVDSDWAQKSEANMKNEDEYWFIENFELTKASVIFMRSDPPVDDIYLDGWNMSVTVDFSLKEHIEEDDVELSLVKQGSLLEIMKLSQSNPVAKIELPHPCESVIEWSLNNGILDVMLELTPQGSALGDEIPDSVEISIDLGEDDDDEDDDGGIPIF